MPLRRLAVPLVAMLWPALAGAQLSLLEGLLSNFTDVSIYYTQSRLARSTPEVETPKRGLRGFGFEFLLTAAARAKSCETLQAARARHEHRTGDPCAPPAPPVAAAARRGAVPPFALDECTRAIGLTPPPAPPDSLPPAKDTVTTPSEITVTLTTAPGQSETRQVSCKVSVQVAPHPVPADTSLTLEIGLGYGQFSGFRSRGTTFDLRGAVRELPTLSVYATREHTIGGVYPYAGIRTGLAVLQGGRVFVDSGGVTTAYTVDGSTFQLGGVAGVAIPLPLGIPAYLLAEYSYMSRNFASLEWNASSTPTIPLGAPRRLDVSSRGWMVGLQAPLGKIK